MLLWIVGMATALLTAVYMIRLMVLTFRGKSDLATSGRDRTARNPTGMLSHGHHGAPHESPRVDGHSARRACVGCAFAGYLGVPEGLRSGKIASKILEPSSEEPSLATAGEARAGLGA